MGLAAAVYERALRALLPPGRVWQLRDGDLLSRLLRAAADELERIDGRAADLLAASDPRTPGELLTDFERVLKLPGVGTIFQRVGLVVARLVLRQRVRPIDYQTALAQILGLDPDLIQVIEIDHVQALSMDDPRAVYRFYVWRDPGLGGSYDIAGAQAILDDLEHSHTSGKVIESIVFRCDDPFSLCDRDLLGF